MKRKFLKLVLSISLLYAGHLSYAQNTYPFPQTGAVGIGTTSPQQALVVSNSNAEGLEVYLAQPTGVVGLQSYNRSTNAYSSMQFDADKFGFMHGNVGIGTTAPDAGLHIFNSTVADFLKLQFSASGGGYWALNPFILGVSNGGLSFVDKLNSTTPMVISSTGNVGIGTTSPGAKFDVNGEIRWGTSSNYLYSGHDPAGGYVELKGTTAASSVMRLQSSKTGDNTNYSQFFIDPQNGFLFNTIGSGNGNVGIGTTSPDEKLTVAGTVHSREVKVTVDAGADYVFKKDYNLPSLKEVETYIAQNQHLPEIASAAEMKEKGIELGDMNIKLLKKIEELTLYMIRQNRTIENQSAQISTLLTDNKQFKTELEKLKAVLK